MEITKETIRVKRVIAEKKEIINVQGDMIVPDSKPDILNTVNTSGSVCIYKKEIMEGKIRLDGNVLTYVMYLADEEKNTLRGLNTGLDFSENIAVSELEANMDVEITPVLKLIECKILNGRKVGLKATLEINIKIFSKDETSIISQIEDSNIQLLSKNKKINSLVGDGKTKAYVKENISISSTDNLAEILNVTANLVDKDNKISYNKVLAKSEVEIKIVYLTEEGKIVSCTNRVPLVGFIDMQDIKEDNIIETNYLVKNILIKPNSIEEHSVYFEMEVEISCFAYENKEIKVIEDMYCPGEKVEFDSNTLKTIANRRIRKNTCSIREKINAPEVGDDSIIDVLIYANMLKENRLNGKIIIEGELNLNIIYKDNSSIGVNTKPISIPYEQTIDEIDANCRADTQIETNSQEISAQNGVISVNVDLGVNTITYEDTEISVIDNITEEPMDEMEDYSVIIYVVRSGDTLWKIAKRYGSTVDDIVRVNGIENPDRINVGEKIYIPKYVLKRAQEPIVIN